MERALNYNWNVYKVFKNGKRAKAPILQFESTEEEHADYFENEIRKNLKNSMRKEVFKLIRADLPQQREAEVNDINNDKHLRERNKALSKIFAKFGIKTKRPVATALIYYSESDWRWQWAAIESGTSKYIKGLSPKFNTTNEAEEWLKELISSNQ